MMKLKRLWRDNRGMTLVEALVGIGLLVIVSSATATGLFHAAKTQTTVIDDGLAIHTIRNNFSWLAQDMRRAQTAEVEGGGSAITMTWTNHYEDEGTEHTVTYHLDGNKLVRTFDGDAHTVMRRVIAVSFLVSDSTIVADVEVDAGSNGTKVMSLRGVRRSTE